MATIGHKSLALNRTLELPSDVFTSAGGSGHSLTNTLYYISTLPEVKEPMPLVPPTPSPKSGGVPLPEEEAIDCGCPDTCTPSRTLPNMAGDYSCHDRIKWLIDTENEDTRSACRQIGQTEYPDQCGGCDPDRCAVSPSSEAEAEDGMCGPCSSEVCQSNMNKCQVNTAPYLCFDGPSKGGCSATPWINKQENGFCFKCCKLSLYCGE